MQDHENLDSIFIQNLDEPYRFGYARMKVGLPTFMLTADEPKTVQTYGHENGEAISYENPPGIFIFVCLWLTNIMYVFIQNLDEPCRFGYARMNVGSPNFMLTADELATVQTYVHENGEKPFS